MKPVLDWGVEVILWLQQFSPGLDAPFRALTFLGEETFLMPLVFLLYWSVDRRTGARLALAFLLSAHVNSVAKTLAGQPRPFDYDLRVRQFAPATGGGLPSGHTQNAVVVWGYLASRLRRPWAWGTAGLLAVLVPLSRLYLGVHFPTDLVGGYLLGGVLLALFLWGEPAAEAWLARRGVAWQLAAAMAPLLLLALPTQGGETYGSAAAAALVGGGVGVVLERRWVGFDSSGDWPRRALRLVLGLALVGLLRWGLPRAFAGLQPEPLFRAIPFLILGFVGAFLVPWAFVKLQLAGRQPPG